jgi:hypothetical protein
VRKQRADRRQHWAGFARSIEWCAIRNAVQELNVKQTAVWACRGGVGAGQRGAARVGGVQREWVGYMHKPAGAGQRGTAGDKVRVNAPKLLDEDANAGPRAQAERSFTAAND